MRALMTIKKTAIGGDDRGRRVRHAGIQRAVASAEGATIGPHSGASHNIHLQLAAAVRGARHVLDCKGR